MYFTGAVGSGHAVVVLKNGLITGAGSFEGASSTC